MSNADGAAAPERAVRERYGQAAKARAEALCCPTDYDPRYLDAIPREVQDRDYGCGDPSRFARPGEAVLDLGSGAGKAGFVLSQIVGPRGRVLGVDFHDDMLNLARRHLPAVASRVGWTNVEFRKGRIQDLGLDLEKLESWLAEHPVRTAADLEALRDREALLRREEPLVPDGSMDLVVSNCVLNLVRPEDKALLFPEMFRVLRRGGRAAISDIVADEPVPEHLRQDPALWTGCVSGALLEEELLRGFAEAGFHGITLSDWSERPFAVVEGIEFRSVTVTAHKGKHGPCYEHNQAVIYRGPFREVRDDDGHAFRRGERAAVCAKTFHLLRTGPYAADFVFLEPREPVPPDCKEPFDCRRTAPRHPRESKGMDYRATEAGDPCAPSSGCC